MLVMELLHAVNKFYTQFQVDMHKVSIGISSNRRNV